MCATMSKNMPFDKEYFVGQNALKYAISRETGYGPSVLMMEDQAYWIFENGTDANGFLGKFSKEELGGTFNIQTNR